MSEVDNLFDGWVAHSCGRGSRFVIAPREFWDGTGRTLYGNPGGDIPGFTFSGYELTPKPDNKEPTAMLKRMGFELRG